MQKCKNARVKTLWLTINIYRKYCIYGKYLFLEVKCINYFRMKMYNNTYIMLKLFLVVKKKNVFT